MKMIMAGGEFDFRFLKFQAPEMAWNSRCLKFHFRYMYLKSTAWNSRYMACPA